MLEAYHRRTRSIRQNRVGESLVATAPMEERHMREGVAVNIELIKSQLERDSIQHELRVYLNNRAYGAIECLLSIIRRYLRLA